MSQDWRNEYQQKKMTPQEAVKLVKSGDTVYVGTCTSVAYTLLDALGEREDELENVTLTCSQVIKPVRAMSGHNPKAFQTSSYFMGVQERNMQKFGLTDFTSVHLSQVDLWCRETKVPDVAFFEVSEPDENGYCCYGASGVALHTYLKEGAKKIILEVNKQVPYLCGMDHQIHISEADALIESDVPLFENCSLPVTKEIQTISDYLLEQIHDGSCIQLGIGGVADAVGYGLKEKNDLGAHTELMTEAMMELMKMGVLNNKKKNFMPGKTVACFSMGSKALYEYIDHNPNVYFMPFPKVNKPEIIAQNDNMISINTAMCIDLFGQVCADNIAGRQHSATGGQVDFVRGAQMSKGGKSFIALTSTMDHKKNGRQSRIVSQFPMGTAVTTLRSDVQYVVTEYGCVNLKPLTMRERVKAMISLSHPDYRPELIEDAKRMGLY